MNNSQLRKMVKSISGRLTGLPLPFEENKVIQGEQRAALSSVFRE